jgi:Flp pilus assembly protein TadG
MRSINQRPVIAASGFWASDEGSVGIIFGLAFMPLLMTAGAATDYTRMTMARSGLQQATDSAVLAVATKITATTTQAQAQALAQVRLNSNSRMATAQITSASISDDKRTFCASSSISVPTTFMKVVGFPSLTPKVTACASLAGGVDPDATYEISLVLDNSGSMSSSAGGVSKMQALRTAATSFVNTITAVRLRIKQIQLVS